MSLNNSADRLSTQKTYIDARHVGRGDEEDKNIRKKGIDKWYAAEYNLLVLLIPLKGRVALSDNSLSLPCQLQSKLFR